MKPTRDIHATLVDLLDRVLDRGLILNADLIIHVAGVPLLGVNLKACLAGMETMLRYGIWHDWDEAQRAVATEEYRRKKRVPLAPDEEVVLKMFASLWCDKGISHCWRPCHLYVTDRRVFLFRKEPAELLFECRYEDVRDIATAKKVNDAGKETYYLNLWLWSGEVVQLHPSDALAARDVIGDRMRALRVSLAENLPPLTDDEARAVGSERAPSLVA